MNGAMWTYFFMLMGILGIFLINAFGNVIMDDEQSYYLLKEITEASMIDAIDYKSYREGAGWDNVTSDTDPESMHCMSGVPGTVRIIKEKFVESFIRRFSSNAQLNRRYRIIFHDIDECPPKVSVSIVASEEFSMFRMFNVDYQTPTDIVNSLTGILEANVENKVPEKIYFGEYIIEDGEIVE